MAASIPRITSRKSSPIPHIVINMAGPADAQAQGSVFFLSALTSYKRKMRYTKSFLALPNNLRYLSSGLNVTDEPRATSYLERIGYYRLTAIGTPLGKSSHLQALPARQSLGTNSSLASSFEHRRFVRLRQEAPHGDAGRYRARRDRLSNEHRPLARTARSMGSSRRRTARRHVCQKS